MTMDQDASHNLTGKVINNFELQEVVGKGGMGFVYRAYHPDLERYSAVKIMRPSLANQPGFLERFLQEARTAARLEHPNIVDVTNFGDFEGNYYLMMDFIEGPSLRQLVNENSKGLPIWDAIQIGWQIADVLVYSHASGVLHRDLKPDNILLTHSVQPRRPYRVIVTDFGLVKLGQGSLLETQEGISVGTPAYMSPEQCQGGEVDGRTDLYALGVMLYEMVTGKRPYPIRNLFDAIKFHSSGTLVPPRAHVPEIPQALDELIRRMLAPSLAHRLGSAAEATDALHDLIMELGETSKDGKTPSTISERVRSASVSSAAEAPPEPAARTATPSATPPESTSEDYYVQVAFEDEWDKHAYPLGDGPLIVGRLPASNIVLDRPEQRYVSKQHCEIRMENGRILIRDLSSTNGTFLGGLRLEPNVLYEWRPGSEVHLGPFKLALRTGEALRNVPSPPADKAQADLPMTKVHTGLKLCCPNAVPSRLPLLPDRPLVIGRFHDCDMVLNNAQISKHHCRVQLGVGGPEVVDLRSTNGTYMGGKRLPAQTPVPWDWQQQPFLNVGPFKFSLEDTAG
jgi:eukaryotic-like serine/threonine-protein kinase